MPNVTWKVPYPSLFKQFPLSRSREGQSSREQHTPAALNKLSKFCYNVPSLECKRRTATERRDIFECPLLLLHPCSRVCSLHFSVHFASYSPLSPNYNFALRTFRLCCLTWRCICSLCLLIWDIIITFDQEVEYIWKKRPRITVVNVLFILNRWWVPLAFILRNYRNLATDPDPKVCLDVGTFILISQNLNTYVFEVAMAIRVWALYDRSRRVLYFFTFLLGSFIASSTVITTITITHVRGNAGLSLDQKFATGCTSVNPHIPSTYSNTYYSYLILETIFFVMTMYQVFRHGRAATRASLMIHVARTGILYFFFALVAILFAVIGSRIRSPLASAFNSNFLTAILSLNCSRLILSIRDAYNQPYPSLHVPTDLELSSVNGIRSGDIDPQVQPRPESSGSRSIGALTYGPGASNCERVALEAVERCDEGVDFRL